MDGADLTFCALRKKASQSEAVTFILQFDGNMFKNVLRVRLELKIDPVGVPAHSHFVKSCRVCTVARRVMALMRGSAAFQSVISPKERPCLEPQHNLLVPNRAVSSTWTRPVFQKFSKMWVKSYLNHRCHEVCILDTSPSPVCSLTDNRQMDRVFCFVCFLGGGCWVFLTPAGTDAEVWTLSHLFPSFLSLPCYH